MTDTTIEAAVERHATFDADAIAKTMYDAGPWWEEVDGVHKLLSWDEFKEFLPGDAEVLLKRASAVAAMLFASIPSAFAAQAERIKELEDAFGRIAALKNSVGLGPARAIAEAALSATPPAAPSLPADVVALVKALKPFARNVHTDHADDDNFQAYFRAGDIRRAKAEYDAFADRVAGEKEADHAS